MSTDPAQPVDLAAAVRQLVAGMEHAGHTLTVQGAMGWMFRGRLTDARDVLRKLPTGALQQASVAATALAALADEMLTHRPADPP